MRHSPPANFPLPSVSLRPVLYREFYFALVQRTLRTFPFALFAVDVAPIVFCGRIAAAFSAVVFPRGIPTYLHNHEYSFGFSPSICLRWCLRLVRVRSSMSFCPLFSSVTNGSTLVSIELGSNFHCLSQVWYFPFCTLLKTWASVRSGNAPHTCGYINRLWFSTRKEIRDSYLTNIL